jgi:subtilisin family serine protease
MRTFLSCLLFTLTFFTLAAGAAFENSSVVGQVPDRVVITLKPGLDPQVSKADGELNVDVPALNALARRFDVKDMARLYPWMPKPEKAIAEDPSLVWAIDFPATYDLETVRAAYEALPEVEKAQAVDICRNHAFPNDPALASQQWYLRNTTLGMKDIRAVGGWAESEGDTNVVIAICDSGVDWMHPDLGGTGPNYLDGAIRINWSEWGGTPGVDDDLNGFIDDFRGWDFVTGVTGYPDEDTSTADNDPMDYESHGTNCAGCAAAITDNGIGIAGAAYDCKILPVRVGWLPNGETIGVVRMDFASQGMLYASANGAKIINCSWGSTSFLSMAVTSCVSAGCIIITSAGNDNDESSPSYLSTNPNVLSVAATDQNDLKASFSNFGTWVELAAPGVGIYTTYYYRSTGTHGYGSVDGTSFSSPIACGAAALIWSAHPAWTRTTVMSTLRNTADDLDAINPGYAGKLGDGRPNLLKALGNSFLEIPDEFPTLLDAMNEAAPGDTAAVLASHALNGTQTIAAKPIAILGGYAADYGSRDPSGSPTVINASVSNTAMQFQSGTTSSTVVDGFRCTGGGGKFFSGLPYNARCGGGIVMNEVSPTLRNIEVTGNAVGTPSELGCGGGIFMYNSTSTLTACKVHENGGIYGSGLFIYQGAPVLADCQIYDNTSRTDNLSYPPLGGGLHVVDADVTLQGCQIHTHDNLSKGGGIYADNLGGSTSLQLEDNEIYGNLAKSQGGGIYMGGDSISMLRDNLHDNGKTLDATFMYGGGFYIEGAEAVLDSITCQGNSAMIAAGGIITGAPSAQLLNSLIIENPATIFSGGFYYENNASGTIAGNTVADNVGTGSGAAGVYITGSSPTVNNNISAYNTGGAAFANGFHVASGSPSFLCDDVYGNDSANYGGIADQTGVNGNVSADPKFCDRDADDYRIDEASPCAPVHSGGCGLIGSEEVITCISGVGDEDTPPVPIAFTVEQYPNPFNPATVIRFALPRQARTTVKIYDLAGRLVRTLADEVLAPATYEVTWTGQDNHGREVSAGVYFYRVRSGEKTFTGQMALVK